MIAMTNLSIEPGQPPILNSVGRVARPPTSPARGLHLQLAVGAVAKCGSAVTPRPPAWAVSRGDSRTSRENRQDRSPSYRWSQCGHTKHGARRVNLADAHGSPKTTSTRWPPQTKPCSPNRRRNNRDCAVDHHHAIGDVFRNAEPHHGNTHYAEPVSRNSRGGRLQAPGGWVVHRFQRQCDGLWRSQLLWFA
jgi:hypothetical protein